MLTQLDQALVALFLFLTMLGMGATLAVRDFARVAGRPWLLLLGLASQFGWMPAIAFALARLLSLPDPLALGLVIMGCSSGGTTSNLFSYYARADLALSISMTVASTVAALALMPLVLWIWASPFTGTELAIPYGNVVLTLVAVLVPVSLGVTLRSLRPGWAARAERIGSISGLLVLALVIVGAMIREGSRLLEFGAAEIAAGTLLGPIGFGLGYLGARLLGTPVQQLRAVSLETGIQNAPLALGIILVSFDGPVADEILRIPLLYGVLVVPASAALALAFRRGRA